ncbi:uncharacterized protein EV420DRAFT_1749549 [Desarmillaria tabescens]|uniref:Uncharacterized protein n=1 Tax=Armillaria tabescens TaxID=1929756 RepID=A0AA39K4K8_ARMTA|nr:uncharacterized protein EV420DRAFT_1749549 [Desarmillaria tabescens]KAK0454257.1 hypothetical protein EV420DRAFT_1749549 [Desarmillaria tabescens]
MFSLVWWPFVVAYISSVVLGKLAVDTPYAIMKGETTTLSWSGGSEPFTIVRIPKAFRDPGRLNASTSIVSNQSIISGDDPSASPLADLGSTNERTMQYQWPFDSVEHGNRVAISVHDANGEMAQSAPVLVIN